MHEEHIDFPEETLDLSKRIVSIMKKRGIKSKKRLRRIMLRNPLQYVDKRNLYTIGFSFTPTLLNDGKMRWPHEITGSPSSFERVALTYCIARELDFDPKMYLATGCETSTTNSDKKYKIPGEFAVLELLCDKRSKKRRFYHPKQNLVESVIVEKADNRLVIESIDGYYMALDFESYTELSLPEIIARIEYLRTPQGVIDNLTSTKKVMSYSSVEADHQSYMRYDKDNNAVVFNLLNNRPFMRNRHTRYTTRFDDNGNIQDKELQIFLTTEKLQGLQTEDLELFCNIDYSLLEKMHKVIRFRKKYGKSYQQKFRWIARAVVEGKNLEAVSEKTGASIDDLIEVHQDVNANIDENLERIRSSQQNHLSEDLLLTRAIYEARLRKARKRGQEYLYSDEQKKRFFENQAKLRAKSASYYEISLTDEILAMAGLGKTPEEIRQTSIDTSRLQGFYWERVKYLRIWYKEHKGYFNYITDQILFNINMARSAAIQAKKQGCTKEEYIAQLAKKENATMEQGYRAMYVEHLTTLFLMKSVFGFRPYMKHVKKMVKDYMKTKR